MKDAVVEIAHNQVYPISELFVAPQGEGTHAGKLMAFIRFAGCTVGKPYPTGKKELLPIYAAECKTYDGRAFMCDTDFRVKERLTAWELLKWVQLREVYTVLLTGGEPLMHDMFPLAKLLYDHNFAIHVETSGTIVPTPKLAELLTWICVSPKTGFNPILKCIADEFKLLVDENFDWEKVPQEIKERESAICISPINGEHELDRDNMDKCLEIQRHHPHVRITLQMHKIWGTR